MAKRCQEEGCDGQPLRHSPTGKCLFHDDSPLGKHLRNQGRSKGGTESQKKKAQESQDRGQPPDPESFQDLADWVSWLIGSTSRGTVSQGEADVLGKLIAKYRKILPKVYEEVELEEKVEDLADNNQRLRTALEKERSKTSALESKTSALESKVRRL